MKWMGRSGIRMDMALPYKVYSGIDLAGTGRHLKELVRSNGISVKEIQNLLHLSCPQPVYRWMKGQVLPTVDHLYALARLFSVHMEELLVQKSGCTENLFLYRESFSGRRLSAYREYVQQCGDDIS